MPPSSRIRTGATGPVLVIRADANPAIGHGHLVRCLALGDAWVLAGGQLVVVASSLPSRLAAEVVRIGASLVEATGPPGSADDARALAVEADRVAAEWVVLDGYHFSDVYQAEVRSCRARLAVIDDHARIGRYKAEVVLDQNLGSDANMYMERMPSSMLLLGPAYALLRRQFVTRGPRDGPPPAEVRRLLVTLGGHPTAAGWKLVSSLASDDTLDPDIEIHWVGSQPREATSDLPRRLRVLGPVEDMAEVLTGVDLALAASGSTVWELCRMGVPGVLVSVAPNQELVAGAVAGAGAAVDVGRLSEVDPDEIARIVSSLARDQRRRAQMSAAARLLVDGYGCLRASTELRSFLVRLRPVTAGDATVLWEMANDPETRRASLTTDPIPWERHVAWLEEQLADPTADLFLAITDGEVVGQARFAKSPHDGHTISMSIGARYRGRHLAAPLVRAAVRRLWTSRGGVPVHAFIRQDNRRSQSVFISAGFTKEACLNSITRYKCEPTETDV